MMGRFTIGNFYPAQSLVHNLDPRTKITGVFLYIFALFLANTYGSYLLIMSVSLAIIALSKVPVKIIARAVKPILIFVLITAFVHVFLTPGTEIWRWKIFKITREGLEQAVFMTFRLILLIGVSSLLTFTTKPVSLTDGMEKMLRPLNKIGVPVHELAMMMTIALRFVPTLLEETDKIMRAQASRGANFRTGSITKRVKTIIPLLVPLFLSAFRRAEDLAMAMEARGYHGGAGRTRMRVLSLGCSDGIALLVMILLVIVMGYYRWLM